MRYTLLVEGKGLLESKHKCMVDVETLSDLKAALLADLKLQDIDVLMELFDNDFEEFVAFDKISLIGENGRAKIKISRRRPANMKLVNNSRPNKPCIAGTEHIPNAVGTWSPKEQQLFEQGLLLYGRDWKKILHLIQTRTLTQIRSHAQKYFKAQKKHQDRQARLAMGALQQSGAIPMRPRLIAQPPAHSLPRHLSCGNSPTFVLATAAAAQEEAEMNGVSHEDAAAIAALTINQSPRSLGFHANSEESSQGQGTNQGRWTDVEKHLFEEGLQRHGRDWKRVGTYVQTRTLTQIRTHAQKYFKKLEGVGNGSSNSSNNRSGTTNTRESHSHPIRIDEAPVTSRALPAMERDKQLDAATKPLAVSNSVKAKSVDANANAQWERLKSLSEFADAVGVASPMKREVEGPEEEGRESKRAHTAAALPTYQQSVQIASAQTNGSHKHANSLSARGMLISSASA